MSLTDNFNRIKSLTDNFNRIKEMKEAGLGNNAIAGIFQEYGFDLKPEHIDPILEFFCKKEFFSCH